MWLRSCSKCELEKDSSEFYSDYRSKCKSCAREDAVIRGRNKEVRRRRHLSRYKMNCGCYKCGFNESPHALDLHHIDPETKSKTVSAMLTHNLKDLINEVRKCVVICANCHRRLHAGEFDNGQT